MATLKQDSNSNTTYLGWYGSCGEPKCEKFDLSSKKDIIRTVYQFTENGKGIRTFSSNAPDFLQGFTHLNCGNSYWIILKPGNSEIEIPEFTLGYDTDKSLGLISSDCSSVTITEPTPTPTPKKSSPCTKDLRRCPDGTMVGRNSKDKCRFPVCGWDSEEFRNRANDWKYNEPMYYSFTFMYTGTSMPRDRVKVTVRFGRIIRMQKIGGTQDENLEEMSLDYNDSISDQEHFAPSGRSRILTLSQLFHWTIAKINISGMRPYSAEIKYNEEFDFMERCIMTYPKTTSKNAFSIGFVISDFKEYEYKGKCPPHKRRCKDGTYVTRDPNNNCKFKDCGDSDSPTPTPVDAEIPLMKFRWLKVDEYSILQIKNLPKPLGGGIYTDYRTVYGSNILNPKDQTVLAWQHIKVGDEFVKAHKGEVNYSDMKFTFDSENENQLVVDLGDLSQFNRTQSDSNEVSHLYFYRDDISSTDYKLAATFPYIIKTENSDMGEDVEPVPCPEDAKLCDDGSILTRDPYNNCEFPLCPEEQDNMDEYNDDSNDDYDDDSNDEFVPPTDDPDAGVYEDVSDDMDGHDDYNDDSNDEFVPPTDDPEIDETYDDSNDEFVPPTDDPEVETYGDVTDDTDEYGEYNDDSNDEFVPPTDDPEIEPNADIADDTDGYDVYTDGSEDVFYDNNSHEEFVPPTDDPIIEAINGTESEFLVDSSNENFILDSESFVEEE